MLQWKVRAQNKQEVMLHYTDVIFLNLECYSLGTEESHTVSFYFLKINEYYAKF